MTDHVMLFARACVCSQTPSIYRLVLWYLPPAQVALVQSNIARREGELAWERTESGLHSPVPQCLVEACSSVVQIGELPARVSSYFFVACSYAPDPLVY